MDNGATGQSGRPAQKHAAKENKQEPATAQIQHHVTEENSVLGMRRRHRTAISNHVQYLSCVKAYIAIVLKHCIEDFHSALCIRRKGVCHNIYFTFFPFLSALHEV